MLKKLLNLLNMFVAIYLISFYVASPIGCYSAAFLISLLNLLGPLSMYIIIFSINAAMIALQGASTQLPLYGLENMITIFLIVMISLNVRELINE